MSDAPKRWKPATEAVRGVPAAPQAPSGESEDLSLPIRRASVWAQPSTGALDRVMGGREPGWFYARFANPTVDAVERKLARLEGASGAVLTGSGMAAISATLFSLTGAGKRVVATRDLYGTASRFLRETLARFGVETVLVPTGDVDAFARALAAKPTAVAYLESPTNPLLRVLDLDAYAALAREHGAITVVDATFASPWNCRALDHGADVVVESATKFLGGHSDLTMGVIAARDASLLAKLRATVVQTGPVADPQGAFLLDRGLKTLAVRMDRQNANALALARALEARGDLARVLHPLLPSHPDHKVASRVLRGLALVTLDAGTLARATRVVEALELARNGPSLGGVETLVSQSVVSSHRGLPAEELDAMGVTPGTIRVSVGIEDEEDLIADFSQALDRAR